MVTYLQNLQIVLVPFALEPRLKKYKISSAKLQGAFIGGGARRTGEAGLGDVPHDPAVGITLSRECDRGEAAWPPSNSGVIGPMGRTAKSLVCKDY